MRKLLLTGGGAHLVSLFVFSTVMIGAVGLVLGALLESGVTSGVAGRAGVGGLLIGAVLLCALGAVAALFHLGRPGRFLFSVRGIAHSPLSREIVFFFAFAALTAAATLLEISAGTGFARHAVLIAAGLSGTATLWFLATLYDLPVQLTWRGVGMRVGPLLGAVLLAVAVAIWNGAGDDHFWLTLLFVLLIVADLLRHCVSVVRRRRSETDLPAAVRHRGLWTFVGVVQTIRYGFTAVLLVLLVFEIYRPLPLMLFAMIAIDRWTFYGGAIQSTPGSEIARLRAQRLQYLEDDVISITRKT